MPITYRSLAEFLAFGVTGRFQSVKEIHLNALEWEDLRAALMQMTQDLTVSEAADGRPHFIVHGVKIVRSGEL